MHHYGMHTRFAHVGRRKGIEWQGNQGSVRPLQERAQCIAATVMIIVEDFELSLIAWNTRLSSGFGYPYRVESAI